MPPGVDSRPRVPGGCPQLALFCACTRFREPAHETSGNLGASDGCFMNVTIQLICRPASLDVSSCATTNRHALLAPGQRRPGETDRTAGAWGRHRRHRRHALPDKRHHRQEAVKAATERHARRPWTRTRALLTVGDPRRGARRVHGLPREPVLGLGHGRLPVAEWGSVHAPPAVPAQHDPHRQPGALRARHEDAVRQLSQGRPHLRPARGPAGRQHLDRGRRGVEVPPPRKHVRVLQSVLTSVATTKNPVDMFTYSGRFTLDAFGEIAFGFNMSTLTLQHEHPFERAFVDAQHIAASRLVVPTWYWKLKRSLNVGSEKRLREALTTVDQFVMDVISKTMDKRNAPHTDTEDKTRTRDIVSLILANETVDGKPVDPILVRNVVLMALIAGRDTAADALAWLFHLLTLNPRVEEKLRAYLLDKLPKLGTDFDYVPDMQDVQNVPYLEATINEALRLYSPVGLAQKLCVRDTVFPDGTFVPKGSNIALVYHAMARMPGVWGPDAASFVPERFIDPDTGELLKVSSGKFSAFNTGPRVCVGRKLAMMEMKMVVACVVSRFRFDELPGQDVACSGGLTIGMKNPLMMRVEQRVPAADKDEVVVGVAA
ncbi:hypothetical protein ON010_g2029 [Phytophthora cinnamomi]|nr:hypothetical protein ON010_g2029 [Phytophthora cinnamomi]